MHYTVVLSGWTFKTHLLLHLGFFPRSWHFFSKTVGGSSSTVIYFSSCKYLSLFKKKKKKLLSFLLKQMVGGQKKNLKTKKHSPSGGQKSRMQNILDSKDFPLPQN